MPHTISVGGRAVESSGDASILEAFLRAGVWMPNSCNQGTCGSCKLQVLSGGVDHRDSPPDTLPAGEREAGLVLACQARATCDTVVALRGGEQAQNTHVLRDIAAEVVGIEEIARDTRRILLALDEPLEFSAGQYVELEVPGAGQCRPYSLANTPAEDMILELHVRSVAGGVGSEWIFGELAVGDTVKALGPFGDFCLPEADDGGPMALIGGGTGLAPILGIARAALARDTERHVLLYHNVRSREYLYDRERLAAMTETHPNFRYVAVLSQEDTAEHRHGHATDLFVEDVESARGWSGWLCGPPSMVDAGVKAFKRRRMAPRLIRREKFTPADASAAPVAVPV